jgi:large subunit ribosomal protein L15
MVKTHKRTKNSRIRGARTVGWGFRQKHKGHGNKGGFGMAGTGKRADHKKQSALMTDTKTKKKYFGKQGLTSRGTAIAKYEKINLYAVKDNMYTKEGCKIDLKKHKILGHGDGFNAVITALFATEGAIKKMQAAGGKIILPANKDDVKQYKKVEKKVVEEKSKDEE